MKPTELKNEYVRLRAEGKSYNAIADQLHISKSTCTAWDKELQQNIDELKKSQLAELCEEYGMTKESRIRKLGETLEKIEDAISKADFSMVDPAKLLDFKLKYTEALKGEYVGSAPETKIEAVDADGVIAALGDLLTRVRAGEVTTEQANKESMILSQILKAYDTAKLKTKLEELEAIVGGRQQ